MSHDLLVQMAYSESHQERYLLTVCPDNLLAISKTTEKKTFLNTTLSSYGKSFLYKKKNIQTQLQQFSLTSPDQHTPANKVTFDAFFSTLQ